MMKKLLALGLALVFALTAAGCNNPAQKSDVAGKTYVYEKDGFGGGFSIALDEDGSFQYNEGPLSSYIGVGTWQLDGNVLVLSDDAEIGYDFVNHFQAKGETLVFQEKDSSNFLHVNVADGERFIETDDRQS